MSQTGEIIMTVTTLAVITRFDLIIFVIYKIKKLLTG